MYYSLITDCLNCKSVFVFCRAEFGAGGVPMEAGRQEQQFSGSDESDVVRSTPSWGAKQCKLLQ